MNAKINKTPTANSARKTTQESSWWRHHFTTKKTCTNTPQNTSMTTPVTKKTSKREALKRLTRFRTRQMGRNGTPKAHLLEVDTGNHGRFSLRRSFRKHFGGYSSKTRQKQNDMDSFVARLTMELIDDFTEFADEYRTIHIASRATDKEDTKRYNSTKQSSEMQHEISYLYLPSQKVESCIDLDLESKNRVVSSETYNSFINNSDYENYDEYDTNSGTVFSEISSKSTLPTGTDMFNTSPGTTYKQSSSARTIYLPRLRPLVSPTVDKNSALLCYTEKKRLYPGATPLIPHSY